MTDLICNLHDVSHSPAKHSYQQLSSHDRPRIEAFFLSLDFDQRRAYFGGGMSDHSIVQFCRTIDWTRTELIARSGRYCLESLAIIVALPGDGTRAELAVVCPLMCDQRRIMSELLANVIEFAAIRYRRLLVRREGAHPDLVAELRHSMLATFAGEEIRIDLGRIEMDARLSVDLLSPQSPAPLEESSCLYPPC
ncbi:MAG: hypothetical protein U1E61_18335 [Bradyrhizobium sp.]